ncbi:MAG: hypothetical protein ACAI18_19800 [Gemmatimonadales bacterium]
MWTHSDVAVLLKAAQTANLLQQEEIAEPKPGVDALLDRWERVVDAFIAEPGVKRMGPRTACMRELVEFVS